MKEKLQELFGSIGIVLFGIIRIALSVLPFVMIDVSFFLTVIFIAISGIIPGASVIFWVWGLVYAIKGTQDAFAIAYYVLFVVLFVPTFISTVFDILRNRRK